MRVIYCILLALCFSMKGFSQFENPKRSIRISPKKQPDATPKPTSAATTPAVIKYESSLDKNEDKLLKSFSLLPKKEERGIMNTDDPTIRNPSEIYTKQQNDRLKSEGYASEITDSDLFLGEYTVYTDKIDTKCRDYSAIDGDNISIYLNDELVVPRVSLESGFKSYVLDLKMGLNIIRIHALDVGASFPNTGQFVFYDSNGKLITNQYWGLYEGYNAVVRVVRMEGIGTGGK